MRALKNLKMTADPVGGKISPYKPQDKRAVQSTGLESELKKIEHG